MNWRYIIGKSLSNLGNAALSSRLMPRTRFVPVGLSYPYDIKRFQSGNPVTTILDAGANIGQTSLFLTRHFPQANIFAFEPIKDTYETLKHNSQKRTHIQPVNLALGAEIGQKTIRIRDNSELNTLVDSSNQAITASEQTETIHLTTLDQFCKDQQVAKINLLKMDVQGYELELLRGADYYLSQHLIDFIYSEVGFDKASDECQNFDALNDCLVSYGFRLSGFYEVFRWGANKRYFGFCNALFVNCNL